MRSDLIITPDGIFPDHESRQEYNSLPFAVPDRAHGVAEDVGVVIVVIDPFSEKFAAVSGCGDWGITDAHVSRVLTAARNSKHRDEVFGQEAVSLSDQHTEHEREYWEERLEDAGWIRPQRRPCCNEALAAKMNGCPRCATGDYAKKAVPRG